MKGTQMAYVSEYGNYGAERIIQFEDHELPQEQWELIAELPDNDRYRYVVAFLDGEDLSEWE